MVHIASFYVYEHIIGPKIDAWNLPPLETYKVEYMTSFIGEVVTVLLWSPAGLF